MDLKSADTLIRAFIQSSKSESARESSKVILQYLSAVLLEARENNSYEGGWVRSKDLLSNLVESGLVPYNTQFFRLLDRLVDFNLLEKMEVGFADLDKPRGRGKAPTYYRASMIYPDFLFLDRIDLLISYQKKIQEIEKTQKYLDKAIDVLIKSEICETIEDARRMIGIKKSEQLSLDGMKTPPPEK